MSLTNTELQQFNEEGYVVKPAVFSSEALQPIQDALGEIVDTEAKRLQSEGCVGRHLFRRTFWQSSGTYQKIQPRRSNRDY